MIFFDKEKKYGREEVGGKALGLLSLLHMGCNVPDFFIVPPFTDVSAPEFASALDEAAKRLGCPYFAVRSSNVAEDAEDNSFAGQYDTLLEVERKELLSAVQRVVASVNGSRTQAYAKKAGVKPSGMAVIVQKQIFSKLSGVAFSTSPFDATQAIVESGQGQGELLVSGETTPNTFVFSKTDRAANGVEGEVFALSQKLEKQLKKPLDLEWAYDGELYLLQMRPLTVLPAQLQEIKGEFNEYVYRDFSFFNHYVQALATDKALQEKAFGFHVPIFEGILVDGHEFYSQNNDKKTDRLWKSLDKGDFFERFIKRLYLSVQKSKRYVKALQKMDFSSVDNKRLGDLFDLELNRYTQSYLPLMMRPDDYLTQKLYDKIGQKAAEEGLFFISYPNKRTYYGSEKFDFLCAAISYKKGDEQPLNAYMVRYEWIKSPLGKGFTPLERKEVLSRISALTGAEAEEKLFAMQRQRKQNLILRRKELQKIQSPSTKRLFLLLSEFVHLRTYTTENSDRYFYYIKKTLLREISRRVGVSLEELLYCTPQEVRGMLKGGSYSKAARQRRRGATFYFTEEGFSVYEGNGLALLKKLLPKPDADAELQGSVASSGTVRASVKIITSARQLDKLNKGEILVTKMTTPELVCAMEKASGIITDEGGVTCHAAIIAREYAIPCLVGTSVATQVLKDGMVVELDCIHGVCKIVKE